jgi:ABC-2 type transport system permease protein/bacitracin transport system permease protein
MFAMIKTEFQKIKRYHILLIGLIGMACSPLLQYLSQLVMNEELRNPHFNFAALIDNTIWGNTQIFMPVLFTLTAGYLINREYTDDTLKNILTVPVSWRRFLCGKLVSMGILAVLFGIYSLIVTALISALAHLPDIRFAVFLRALPQMTALSVCVYIVVLPLIAFCSRKPGLFMSGSVVSFLAGYCVLFFKEGLLRNIYPFSAALTVIGFDTADYAGTSETGSMPLALLSLGTTLLISAILILTGRTPETAQKKKPSKKSGASYRPAQRARRAASKF